MRIATNMLFNQTMVNINKRYADYYRINETVSTGKTINRHSDDPVGSGKVLGYRSLLSSLEQYTKNIDTGITWLSYTETSLSDAESIFTEAKSLAVQMDNGTYNEEQRAMLAVQVEQLYERLMQTGNTKVVDRYIYSGFKTDVKPFTRDDNYNITYSGDNNAIKIDISQITEVQINTTGQAAFIDGTNGFDVLRDLRTALLENDSDAIGASIEGIDDVLNQIITERATVGTQIRSMESSKTVLASLRLDTEELLSNTEDTDLVAAITELNENEVAFEAALQSSSMIFGLSLVNYL